MNEFWDKKKKKTGMALILATNEFISCGIQTRT